MKKENKKINRLIILAHPSKKSFSWKIAKKIQEKYPDTFLMDLYDNEWKQDFLEFQDVKKDWPCDEKIKKIQEKISWADELIFVYPVWWYSQPAILKNFIDINFSYGFAFKYSENGIQNGVLKNKTARIFMTADSPKILVWFYSIPMRLIFGLSTLKFCGLKIKNFTIFSDMVKKRNDEDREKMLKKVLRFLEK